ncbi:PAS fold protein [Fuerstiella marisgermanici]|uniref:PAS fold protein n=2 Tax=Fuerstiella marisgermanici TaxID=1891926 RepID=A0A1P8WMV7_9PLAN|nr:PAS fold protein [Fuerstiella marisgermanici]
MAYGPGGVARPVSDWPLLSGVTRGRLIYFQMIQRVDTLGPPAFAANLAAPRILRGVSVTVDFAERSKAVDELWLILKSQPGVGVLIVDREGKVLFCNDQARQIFYGNDFDPIGMTIEEVEGAEFAAERMPIIRRVIDTGEAVLLRHVRGGRHTESLLWPMQANESRTPRVMAITRQFLESDQSDGTYPCVDSKFVDLGPLDVLTKREIEVLALVGHGIPLKSVAKHSASLNALLNATARTSHGS